MATVADAATAGAHAWDVTGVVTGWLRGDRVDHGFVVKAATEAGGNTVAFHSEEASGSSDRPVLEVEWRHDTGRRASETQVFDYEVDDRTRLTVDATGILTLSATDVDIDGNGLDATIGRTYSSSAHAHDLGVGEAPRVHALASGVTPTGTAGGSW